MDKDFPTAKYHDSIHLSRHNFGLLLGIESSNNALSSSFKPTKPLNSFAKADKIVQSLSKYLQDANNDCDGLFFGPSFLDENAEHFEIFPLIIAKLHAELSFSRLLLQQQHLQSKKKMIVIGMRVEQLPLACGWGQEGSAVDMIYLFPQNSVMTLFAPERPMFDRTTSLLSQKAHLRNFNVLINKTIIGIEVPGKCFKLSNNTIENSNVLHLSTPQICKAIKSFGHVVYDRSRAMTFLLNESHCVDFIWPTHESVQHKLDWITMQGFVGVGLSSVAMDYDAAQHCGANSHYPFHEAVGRWVTQHRSIYSSPNFDDERAQIQLQPTNRDGIGDEQKAVIQQYISYYADQRRRWKRTSSNDTVPDDGVKSTNTTAPSANDAIAAPLQIDCGNLCGLRDETLIKTTVPDAFWSTAKPRTFGGSSLTTHFYPWVVFVQSIKMCARPKPPMYMMCTGVLISLHHVLTAAHCVNWNRTQLAECMGYERPFAQGYEPMWADDVTISYGSHDTLTVFRIGAVQINVTKEFYKTPMLDPRQNDIAIIHLDVKIDRARRGVSPICLVRNLPTSHGMLANTVGWSTESSNFSSPDFLESRKVLNEVLVPLVSNAYCEAVFKDQGIRYNANRFVCAGAIDRGILCGDCGGPIQVERNGLFYLLGLSISSYTQPFFRDVFPDTYTRVSIYCDFISAATRGEVKCLSREYTADEIEQQYGSQFDELLYKKYQRTCNQNSYGQITNLCPFNVLPAHIYY